MWVSVTLFWYQSWYWLSGYTAGWWKCIQERLEVALHRLELRAQLYKQPDRPEDMAAMIIEQVKR